MQQAFGAINSSLQYKLDLLWMLERISQYTSPRGGLGMDSSLV